MRRTAAFVTVAFLAVLTGCEKSKISFTGECRIEKINGKVVSVEVKMPNKGNPDLYTFTVKDRDTMDLMIREFESFLMDLEFARDQMPVIEPPVEQ